VTDTVAKNFTSWNFGQQSAKRPIKN